MHKKILAAILLIALAISATLATVSASDLEEDLKNDINNAADGNTIGATSIPMTAQSAVLMDSETGTVLYAQNAHEALPPASVTKIMTLLIVAEAIENGSISPEDKVTVSANAASMGGSQIFIKEGEEFTVEELLKSAVIASANDAAVALAELITGSEESFADMMNERAALLGMKNSSFENATGLDDTVTKHLTSAYDIALMSRELIKHPIILKYSNVWQDSIRDGEFVLTNTNRLVRYYSGCTGLKTGSTDKAGFCVSATAERDGMHLIAVIMGAPTREERNNAARALLDYGFATFGMYKDPECVLEDVPLSKGTCKSVKVYSKGFSLLCAKTDIKKIEKKYNIPATLTAPISEGAKVGEIVYMIGDSEVGKADICASSSVDRISFADVFVGLIKSLIVGNRRLHVE